jgi:hypothetical protein
MKKIILSILLIATATICCAQRDLEQRFAGYVLTEPGAYKDGVNFGVGVEYRMNVFYFTVSTFVFPNLNGYSCIGLKATILGLNQHFYNHHRIYAGGVVGTIYRGGQPYPIAGGEFGYDYTFPNSNLFIGIGANYLYRSDFEFWEENVSDYWKLSAFAKIGIRF